MFLFMNKINLTVYIKMLDHLNSFKLLSGIDLFTYINLHDPIFKFELTYYYRNIILE